MVAVGYFPGYSEWRKGGTFGRKVEEADVQEKVRERGFDLWVPLVVMFTRLNQK